MKKIYSIILITVFLQINYLITDYNNFIKQSGNILDYKKNQLVTLSGHVFYTDFFVYKNYKRFDTTLANINNGTVWDLCLM